MYPNSKLTSQSLLEAFSCIVANVRLFDDFQQGIIDGNLHLAFLDPSHGQSYESLKLIVVCQNLWLYTFSVFRKGS